MDIVAQGHVNGHCLPPGGRLHQGSIPPSAAPRRGVGSGRSHKYPDADRTAAAPALSTASGDIPAVTSSPFLMVS